MLGWVTPLGSMALGLVAGVGGWFATNYYGRNLLKFWDLRLEARQAIFGSAEANDIRKLAIEIDALRAVMPNPILWYLWCRGYELHGASRSMIALTEVLGRKDHEEVLHRVEAQQALRLPVDPKELETAERYRRIENVPF